MGTVKLKGSFVRAAVPGCCPQTGVLSPLLWCLFVDDLIARLNKDGVNTHFYADDIRGGGNKAGVYGQSSRRRLNISAGK